MCLRIASVGDIMLGENLHHFRRGVASRYMGHFNDLMSSDVLKVVNDSDLFIGNFECSLMPDLDWKCAGLERSMYVAPESAVTVFDGWTPKIVLNVANNHFGQHGTAAADYTVEVLEKNGISCVGRTNQPLFVPRSDGGRFVIWGATIVEDRYSDAGYFKSSAETLVENIKWPEKKEDEYWILSIHWGDEYLTQPNHIQTELTSQLMEKGVDLILGHHPHVVQPSRVVLGNPVIFSHGNFIFDQNFSRITQAGLLAITDLSGRQDFYGVNLKKFRPASLYLFSGLDELDAYCAAHMNRFAPLMMRMFMKVELLLNFWEVPLSLWKFFIFRFLSHMKMLVLSRI